jgi:hypothetical protein
MRAEAETVAEVEAAMVAEKDELACVCALTTPIKVPVWGANMLFAKKYRSMLPLARACCPVTVMSKELETQR